LSIPQISVFLDNKPGSLSQVIENIEKCEIKLFALSIADAGEYGLVRMIVNDPEKTSRILKDADFNLAESKRNTEVIAILINEKDKISNITKLLSETGFDIANNGYYICGGLLFGWENFRLKLGYGYFHPTPVYMGTYPYGLWFRFR